MSIRRIIFFQILGWWTWLLSVACSCVGWAAHMMVRAFESPAVYGIKARTLELVFA